MTKTISQEVLNELALTPVLESATPNRYKGKCAGCGAKVAEAEGAYANGSTWCAVALVSPEFGYICPNANGIIERVSAQHEINRAREVEVAAKNEAISAEAEARRIAYAESDEGKAEVAARKAKAAELKKNGLKICRRCGGAGEADKWLNTGRVCYGCGGSGYITPEVL